MNMPSDRNKPTAMWTKAATNPKRNGNNEETASSAVETNRNSATATATIRTRSPRKIKTQIAKLVYDPSTKPNRDVVVNENETPVVEEEFQKKREDRDREVKEIQEMLNEITNTPTKEKKQEVDDPQEVAVTKNSSTKQIQPVQRSKTETNLRPPNARRSQLRLQSQTARSKSAQTGEKENTSPKQRQKKYSSEEARRYMQEQKKKRKSLQTTAQGLDAKPAIDRSEIKKRLENLRKNTRKIVDKNVKMAKKKAETKEEVPHHALTKELEIHIETDRADIGQEKEKAPKRKTPVEKQQDPSPLSENHKKIGLLRKPEFKDHSFSAIKDLNMDKENLILDILTPQLVDVPKSSPQEVISVEPKKTEVVLSDKRVNSFNMELNLHSDQSKKSELSANSTKRSNSSELDLRIPEAKLKSRTSLREKSVQVNRSSSTSAKPQPKNAELPYWLKPTAVQAYPYNFIMAVRKKLEAIANPPAVASSSSSVEHQPKMNAIETPVSSSNANRSNNAKRRLIDDGHKSLTKSLEKSTSAKENLIDHQFSKSFSEVTSNFSSISIQLPDSNTVSSQKSKSQKRMVEERKPLRVDEDDTTVSSSIFSSPEKRRNSSDRSKNPRLDADAEAHSPLSVENISNLHIKSKSLLKNVNLNRGDGFSDTRSQQRVDTGAVSSRSECSVDFSQLLDDFNRSLSQVIEVNHQLKTTLVKSHQIFSPGKKRPPLTELKIAIPSAKSMELTEYVSDFEESSHAEEKQTNGIQTPTHSSIPEVQTVSNNSSETNAQKSLSPSPTEEESPSSAEEIQSLVSLETQTFIVSSEEPAYDSPRTSSIHNEKIEESPNKDNMSANQYSRDSLETSPREEYIKSHINISRGDFQCEGSEIGPPPSYKATSKSQDTADHSRSNFMNSSLDSEFVRVFNKSDVEISVLSLNRSLSESTINYSSIGLYEKLIQNETNKSDHLAALLKMREKALIDRTKGQIAWLEVQKERYKAKGLTLQISAVKKKQRGILLKMEKEREDIKKLLQQAKVQRDHKLRIPEIRPSSDVTLLQQRRTAVQASAASQAASIYQQQQQSARSKSSAIVRGYELETSRSLEQLLQKREEDLRRRREHVERLMEWHRRLDQEESEVLQLERMLLDYNNVHQDKAQEESNLRQAKMEKKLKEIDKSLRELNSISGAERSTDAGGGSEDFVQTTGSKLNKLWRRLTSQRTEKFAPNKSYRLCKTDLEQLYEDAKLAVLHDFGENAGQMDLFLGQTSISTTQQSTLGEEVPQLNLNFSSGQSDADMMRGKYSPSAAEEEFLGFGAASTSSKEGCSNERGTFVSKKKSRSGTPTSSALLSLPESDQSSSSDTKVIKSLPTLPKIAEVSRATNSDAFSKEVYSTKMSIPESASYSSCSANTESRRPSVSECTSNSPKTENDITSILSASGSTKSDGNQQSSIHMASNASGSAKVNGSRPSSSVFSESTKLSLPGSSKSSVPENASTESKIEDTLASERSNLTKTENNLAAVSNSVLENGLSFINGSILMRTASDAESCKTKSSGTFRQGNSSTKADDNVGDSINDSISTHLVNSAKSESIKGSEGGTVSEISKPNSGNCALSTKTESNRTISTEKTLSEVSGTQSESHRISFEKNALVSDLSTKIESIQTNSVSRSNGSRIPRRSYDTRTDNLADESSKAVSEMDSNFASSASENAVSSVKSSLQYTRTSNPMSENISESYAVDDTQSVVPSNSISANETHSYPDEQDKDWSSIPVLNELSKECNASPSISVSNQSEIIEEACATITSIKSIDNSTNSKHSNNQTTNLATASNSSKPDSHVVPSEDEMPHSEPAPNDIEENSPQSLRDTRLESIPQNYSSEFDFSASDATNTISSNQLRSSVIVSTRESPTPAEVSESLANAFYESDFTESEETNIDDMSLPKFDTTVDEDQFNESQLNISQSSPTSYRTDLEKRLMDLDVSLKDLNATFEKALSPEKTSSPPRDGSSNRSQEEHSVEQSDNALMPDIISEVELRRRQQLMIENELKQFEHAVPYMYVREIPNKPPPPYVPPAHGSPMTTIFPSEERIKNITYRRTKELYHEILSIDATDENGKKPPSVLDENITNIYERIILDICKEYLTEYEPVLTSADPNNFHSALAFFNPPDRLKCMQDFIYKEVRKSLAMDKNSSKRSQVYSVYGHRGKRDHIGEIIIQEMFEEDDRWSNFYVEEEEVLELIIDEMIGGAIGDIATEVLNEEVPRDPHVPAAPAPAENVFCNSST